LNVIIFGDLVGKIKWNRRHYLTYNPDHNEVGRRSCVDQLLSGIKQIEVEEVD